MIVKQANSEISEKGNRTHRCDHMKMKYLLLALAVAPLLFCSCENTLTQHSANSNLMTKDSIKQWYLSYIEEVWNNRDFSNADKYWGTDFKNVFAPQFAHHPEGMKEQVAYFLSAFDSFHFEVKDILIEGNVMHSRSGGICCLPFGAFSRLPAYTSTFSVLNSLVV